MDWLKKIIRTPTAFVVLLAAILGLVGVIVKNNNERIIARIPIEATQTAESLRATQTVESLQATQTVEALHATQTVDTLLNAHTAEVQPGQSTVTLTMSPTSIITPTLTLHPSMITDTFEYDSLNPNLWRLPSDPSVLFVENGRLVFRLTEEKDIDASLSIINFAQPICDISLTMTMTSFDNKGQGGVEARVYLSDGRDYTIGITHDEENSAVEFGICKTKTCEGNYDEYFHPDSKIRAVNCPARIRFSWNNGVVNLFLDDTIRTAAPAEGTPIANMSLSSWITSDGAFEVTVDDLAIIFCTP